MNRAGIKLFGHPWCGEPVRRGARILRAMLVIMISVGLVAAGSLDRASGFVLAMTEEEPTPPEEQNDAQTIEHVTAAVARLACPVRLMRQSDQNRVMAFHGDQHGANLSLAQINHLMHSLRIQNEPLRC